MMGRGAMAPRICRIAERSAGGAGGLRQQLLDVRRHVGEDGLVGRDEQQRHPHRFVPHYTMVTFLRTRYAIALARSEIQREILLEATHGHTDLSRIDWVALETVVHARLEPLEGAH